MRNLLITQKFMFVAVAVSIPIIVLSYFFIAEKNRNIDFTRGELEGTEYLRPIHKLAIDVAAHRDLASAVLAGDASFKPEIAKRAALIDDDFIAIAAEQTRSDLAAKEDVDSVRNDWQMIKSGVNDWKLEQSSEQHTRFLAKILQFGALIANESNLTLDSEVESHYLVDALTFKIPKLSVEISAARAHGAAFIASGGRGEPNSMRRGELAATSVRISDAIYEADHSLRFAAGRPHPDTDAALTPVMAENDKAMSAFSATLVDKVVNGTGAPLPLSEYFGAATTAIDSTAKLWDATVAELDRLLGVRSIALQKTIEIEILVVGLAMLMTIGFLFLVARAITNPIKHLSEVADRISLGDMDATIDIDTKDEIGELGERFRRMQVSLKAAMDALDQQEGGQR